MRDTGMVGVLLAALLLAQCTAFTAALHQQPSTQLHSGQIRAAAGSRMSLLGRRAVAAQAASFAAALALSQQARALSDLDMGEMEAGSGVASSVNDLDFGEPVKIGVVSLDASGKKPKKFTPADRLKELKAKKDLTEKEKKELRKLTADEMCEMLGRGC